MNVIVEIPLKIITMVANCLFSETIIYVHGCLGGVVKVRRRDPISGLNVIASTNVSMYEPAGIQRPGHNSENKLAL